MAMRTNSRFWLALLACMAVITSVGVTTAVGAPPIPSVAGLKVLLTNDDSVQGTSAIGQDGKGLYEMRRALCAAGADVIVAGPWGQQSGSSGRQTTPGASPVPLTVAAPVVPAAYAGDCASAPSGGPVFGVCQAAACVVGSPSASPGDTVAIALDRFLPDNYWATGPDLVVSGTNFGQNVGQSVNHSGTIGAIVLAGEHQVPAVAFSAELDLTCGPNPFDCIPYVQTADFGVDLLGVLRVSGRLNPNLMLNVNYPVVRPDETLGEAVLTTVGTGGSFGFAYTGAVGTGGGTYNLGLGTPVAETRANADTAALAANDISMTMLDANWSRKNNDPLVPILPHL